MKDFPEPLNDFYPVEVLAKALGVTKRHVYRLADDGVIPKRGKGQYPFAESVTSYVEYLKRNVSSSPEAIDFNAEKARKTKAEADIAEIAAAKAKGEVVELRDVERNLEFVFAEVKSNIRNVPQRVAPRIIGETEEHRIKSAILDEIDQAMESMAEGIDWEAAMDEQDAEIEIQQ